MYSQLNNNLKFMQISLNSLVALFLTVKLSGVLICSVSPFVVLCEIFKIGGDFQERCLQISFKGESWVFLIAAQNLKPVVIL